MMNEKIFWEIIERNKDNPLELKDETENMSIEDMYQFFMLIEKMEKPFGLDKDRKIGDFWYDLYEQDIYKLSCDEIMFRGKEFYDAFISCDKDKILDMLNKNSEWKEPVMTVETIQNIYGLKVANEDDLKNFDTDEVIKYYCFWKFWDTVNELGLKEYKKPFKRTTIDDILESRTRKSIETRAYKPSKLYKKALEVEKEIEKVFKQYVPLYRQLCNKEITKEDFVKQLKSQLEIKHGTELEELNNLWKIVTKGYSSDIYSISNIIHLIIMEIFYPEDKNILETDIIDDYIDYYKSK